LDTVATTSTVPASCGGETIVQLVALEQFTEPGFALPNLKVVALPRAKPVPVTVTLVPPDAGPELGDTLSTMGVYLKRSLVVRALVPLTLVTVTSTVPAAAGGDTAVIEVAEFTL